MITTHFCDSMKQHAIANLTWEDDNGREASANRRFRMDGNFLKYNIV